MLADDRVEDALRFGELLRVGRARALAALDRARPLVARADLDLLVRALLAQSLQQRETLRDAHVEGQEAQAAVPELLLDELVGERAQRRGVLGLVARVREQPEPGVDLDLRAGGLVGERGIARVELVVRRLHGSEERPKRVHVARLAQLLVLLGREQGLARRHVLGVGGLELRLERGEALRLLGRCLRHLGPRLLGPRLLGHCERTQEQQGSETERDDVSHALTSMRVGQRLAGGGTNRAA